MMNFFSRRTVRTTDPINMGQVLKLSKENEQRIASIKARISKPVDNIKHPVPLVKQLS